MNRDDTCNRCQLHTQPYHTICLWGDGPAPCPLMLIGEAPGASEDRGGIPFIGEAGVLLNHYILPSLGLRRDKIYVTNVLKCRPKNNQLPSGRNAVQECVDACWQYLENEIQEVDPRAIVLLGSTAMKTLTLHSLISRHEGMEVETIYEGAKTFVSYHPAYALRMPAAEAKIARTIAFAAQAAGMKVIPKAQEDLYPYEMRI